MTKSLDDFLFAPRPTKCECCNNKGLASDLLRYLFLLATGKTEVTLQYVFERHLQPKHKKPRGITSVRRHIRNCLKLDPNTGMPLEDDA